MQTTTQTNLPEQWVKILGKGMVTIPKAFRDQLRMREGEVARIKKVGQRLVIEPRELADYEVYSDQELTQMLKDDQLSPSLAKLASSLWPDLA